MLDATDVLGILDQLDGAGLVVWLDGGWGVDALLGRHSRPHQDLDLVIARDDCDRARAALARVGFQHDLTALPGLPARLGVARRAVRRGGATRHPAGGRRPPANRFPGAALSGPVRVALARAAGSQRWRASDLGCCCWSGRPDLNRRPPAPKARSIRVSSRAYGRTRSSEDASIDREYPRCPGPRRPYWHADGTSRGPWCEPRRARYGQGRQSGDHGLVADASGAGPLWQPRVGDESLAGGLPTPLGRPDGSPSLDGYLPR
jgi:Aminoglycoside-2''-adenylyltransferase